MSSTERKVIYLHERDLRGALERLNRITGLTFTRWPQSLLATPPEPEVIEQPREADIA